MKPRGLKAIAIGTSTALVLVVGVLFVQHLRHGWPFSMHHGLAPVATLSPAAARAAQRARAEVTLDATQLAASTVRVVPVRKETIAKPIRAVASVVPDEGRVSHVHTRVAGWIEQLYVSTTGERVRKGQPLAAIFSQELEATQAEYLAARRAAATGPQSAVLDAARARLLTLGVTEAEIRAIEASGTPRRLITLTAPRAGVVLNRGISVGTAVDPSTEILTVVDLSRVWILAEITEGDIPSVHVGTPARIELPASGGEPIAANVEFLYPTLSERTRTLRVRFSLANPRGALRPGIYGTTTFQTQPRDALTVPRDAVVDTGESQHVFVVAGEGRFVPRAVKLGARLEDRVEILEGLTLDEPVVASGVFLIDSESRLRASGTMGGHSHSKAPAEAQPSAVPAPEDHSGDTGHPGH